MSSYQIPYQLKEKKMKRNPRPMIIVIILLIWCLLSSGIAYSEGSEALKDLKLVKAVIDFKTGNPKKALIYLSLIGDTFKDRNIQAVTTQPDFVVNFGGDSVKLLAKGTKGFSPEEQKTINEIRDKVSALAKEGIKFEYCTYAGNLFGVEPADVEGVRVVDNGWVSVIGYQARGYSLVPAY
jgi:intracellular sulfur oxidation DsrE/DsrF family protein